MSGLVLELNPQVRTIIEAAVRAGRQFWVGLLDSGCDEPWSRLATYLEPNSDGTYTSTAHLEWGAMRDVTVIGAVLAERVTGSYFASGLLQLPIPLPPGDSIVIVVHLNGSPPQ